MSPLQPKISIITVCYNAACTLEKTIQSVCMQSYPSIEYVVIDGKSTDSTVEILEKYKLQDKLKYISEPDNGIYEAMNKGINSATGEWIFFLGSDDIFFDNGVLERIFSKEYGNEEILYGNVKYLYSGIIYDGPFDQEKISVKNICHQSIFYNANVFQKLGLFNLRYRIYADYEFNLRWMGKKLAALFINETIVIYNEKGISGQIIDEVFVNEFDHLLIRNNIISSRSFNALKKMNQRISDSYRYKVGNFIISPFSWIKKVFNTIFI